MRPDHKDWDQFLWCAEFAISNSYQEAVQNTPKLNELRPRPAPTDAHICRFATFEPKVQDSTEGILRAVMEAKGHLGQARKKYMCSTHLVTRYCLTQRTCKEVVEQGVRKLKPRFVGPFVVVKRVRMTAVELDLPHKWSRIHKVFHVSLVKAFCTPGRAVLPPLPLQSLSGKLKGH